MANGGGLCGQPNWDVSVGVVEVGSQADRFTSELDGSKGAEQLLEEDPPFEASEVHTEAEVLRDPEGQVGIGVSVNIEAFRLVEDPLVAVGGRVVQRHLLPGADRHPV